ncbi:hypothetical protein Vadar_033927 [Vaccinium darrowii]|uniref:Uncharacterized protein n=1 Tax=Vaccinium darrowii TaxID=229202 RepID=A0ACB7YS21_9ERIC|nr:hypothetical protein Vadar_033927 [Vaccinium darrowii]
MGSGNRRLDAIHLRQLQRRRAGRVAHISRRVHQDVVPKVVPSKAGKALRLFRFKESTITHGTTAHGVIPVGTCLTIKGVDDVLNINNMRCAFELSIRSKTIYFIAWINAIGLSTI